MADGTQVLREYLMSLGFRVNHTEEKKFDRTLEKIGKSAGLTGISITGVATATAAMVSSFANQMEKLYYASQRTNSTVTQLQGLQFGAKQIGLSSDTMQGAIENMARSLRSSPGLAMVLRSLGVHLTGRTGADHVVDMVKALRGLPDYVAQQYAAMFGMDPDTYFQISRNTEALEKAAALRKQMNQDAGINAEQAAAAGLAYKRQLNELIARAGVLKDVLAISLVGPMTEAAKLMGDILLGWSNIISTWKGWKDFAEKMAGGMGINVKQARKDAATGPSPAKIGSALGKGIGEFIMGPVRKAIIGYGHGPGYANSQLAGAGRGFGYSSYGASTPSGGASDTAGLFARLEARYGLPRGLLDRVYSAESGRGKNLVSPKGALGPFQFMPKTAAEYGISGKEFDLHASAEAAARKYAALIKRYGGNIAKAAAAYNLGEGNFSKVHDNLGAAPSETQSYAQKVAGGLQQTVIFNIHGGNPDEIGKAVGRQLAANNGNLVRDFAGVVQ